MMRRHQALVDVPPSQPLPTHPWDRPAPRAAIHAAFTKWFACYMSGNPRQAAVYRTSLRTLTEAARVRRDSLNGRIRT